MNHVHSSYLKQWLADAWTFLTPARPLGCTGWDYHPQQPPIHLQYIQSLLEGATEEGVCIVTWCHTGYCFAPPKVKLLSTRSTWSLPLSARSHCSGLQASLQCWWPATYSSLTSYPTRKEWKEEEICLEIFASRNWTSNPLPSPTSLSHFLPLGSQWILCSLVKHFNKTGFHFQGKGVRH